MLEIMASTSSTGATGPGTTYPYAMIDGAPEIAPAAHGRGEPRGVDLPTADVLASVTRELRLPLTAIHGTLRLVVGGALGPLTPEASELLAIAGRSCAQLIGLVDDLLGRDPRDGQAPASICS
ncbi:MAG TPA: histidine kinase dimerization/phospho-acceptor domain-containing protein [Thermoanaerobaculia bacterium]|nr:histidine kinase dimerization/phospho-acceptor domain-containing protein [Thermoanaerobaculia bacterium]